MAELEAPRIIAGFETHWNLDLEIAWTFIPLSLPFSSLLN
jgi:hypothetical protein